eukprot:scaffold32385_cov54-Phaeocystis_antarctica.AAC.1
MVTSIAAASPPPPAASSARRGRANRRTGIALTRPQIMHTGWGTTTFVATRTQNQGLGASRKACQCAFSTAPRSPT